MIACAMPLEAPENDRIYAAVVAPTMMNRIIAACHDVAFAR